MTWYIKLCGPHVATPFIQTPMFEWYMEKHGVKNRHQKDMMWWFGLCAKMTYIKSTILGSIASGIGRTHMIILKLNGHLTLWTLKLLGRLYFNSKTWNDNLRGLWMMNGWNNSWANSMAINGCEAWSAPYKTTYLMCKEITCKVGLPKNQHITIIVHLKVPIFGWRKCQCWMWVLVFVLDGECDLPHMSAPFIHPTLKDKKSK